VNVAEAESSAPPRSKQKLAWYVALLVVIFVCCAIAIFSYFLTYPRFRGAVIEAGKASFDLFTVTAPLVFGSAFWLRGRDLIAAAKVHASLYTVYTIVLACKLGPLNADFVSLLFFILLIELVLLGAVMQRMPKDAREISGAPWLFSALTIALLAGSSCGALAWRLAVRADLVHMAPVTGRIYQQ
jgi:hypothetical protein